MIIIPEDLFGAYINGRERAIDANWNDLQRSNAVESGWLNNDAQQLKNWFTQDTYGDNLVRSNAQARTASNAATGSDLNLQQLFAQQPGSLATAGMQSDYQVALANASRGLIPDTVASNLAQQRGNNAVRTAQGNAQVLFAPQQVPALAQANTTNAQIAATQAQNQQQLLPLQTAVTQADLEMQQRVLNNAGQVQPGVTTAVTPQQTTANAAQLQQVAAQLQPGQAMPNPLAGQAGQPAFLFKRADGTVVGYNNPQEITNPASVTAPAGSPMGDYTGLGFGG